MSEIATFIDANPWTTFGVFLVAMQLAYSMSFWFGSKRKGAREE